MSYAGVVGARDRRLLLVSSRARNKPAMYGAVLPGVRLGGETRSVIIIWTQNKCVVPSRVVEYSYETSQLEDLFDQAKAALATQGGQVAKVSSVALVLHSSERELFLCQVYILFCK